MGYNLDDTGHSDVSLLPSTVPVLPPGRPKSVAGSCQPVPGGVGRPATLDLGSRRLGGGVDSPDSLPLLHQEVAPQPSILIAELVDYSCTSVCTVLAIVLQTFLLQNCPLKYR